MPLMSLHNAGIPSLHNPAKMAVRLKRLLPFPLSKSRAQRALRARQLWQRNKSLFFLPRREVECRSDGSCGYSCIAVVRSAMLHAESEHDVVAQASLHGKELRVTLRKHIEGKTQEYVGHWAADPNDSEISAGGSVPTNFLEWVQTILRPNQSVDERFNSPGRAQETG